MGFGRREGYQSVFVKVLETFDDELLVICRYFVGGGHGLGGLIDFLGRVEVLPERGVGGCVFVVCSREN